MIQPVVSWNCEVADRRRKNFGCGELNLGEAMLTDALAKLKRSKAAQ
jgi:hypothetical protein